VLKKTIIIGAVIALIFTLAGCFRKNANKHDNNSIKSTQPTHSPNLSQSVNPSFDEVDYIKKQVDSMTLEEKIGQMLIVGFNSYTYSDDAREMIEKYKVGGFILFSRNIKNTNQLLDLTNSLKNANSKSKIPLFISVDEEGGRVSRVTDELLNIPAGKIIGEINSTDFAFKIGDLLAKKIKAFGFNINFAPVLDVNSNPENSVIGDRSLGSNAETVSKLGSQIMKGIVSNNVISVVKHFPGHGDTLVDSHIGLPLINHDIERLQEIELVPFKKAIKNGADSIMIAHILLTKLDNENPASFSKVIITELLRKEMGFDGLIFTDDMTMGAIIKNYDIEKAAIKSINTGCDIILVCHGYQNQKKVIDALIKAAQDRIISEERIDESVYRILDFKKRYQISNDPVDSVDIDEINRQIESVLEEYLNN